MVTKKGGKEKRERERLHAMNSMAMENSDKI